MTEDTKFNIKVFFGAIIFISILCLFYSGNDFTNNQAEKHRTEKQQIIQECYDKTNDLEWCLINFN